jgi:hypothetical protein
MKGVSMAAGAWLSLKEIGGLLNHPGSDRLVEVAIIPPI